MRKARRVLICLAAKTDVDFGQIIRHRVAMSAVRRRPTRRTAARTRLAQSDRRRRTANILDGLMYIFADKRSSAPDEAGEKLILTDI
ncbi:hypothetical protein D1647_22905 [Alistipes sp. Z76]|nr:hypothetical protein [Alistipes sp. Z76]NCE70998.1 hypothetical protein [Muribaculaceae bacterium M3]